VYGSPGGLEAQVGQAAVEDQIWDRALGGVAAVGDDEYGRTLAVGDFDNDGYDDLAVGIPGARVSGVTHAGAVQVIYGSENGLGVADIQEWSRNSDDIAGTSTAHDRFGWSLTVGDFDGDGHDDLAIGVRYATVNGDNDAGAVHILYGLSAGLSGLGSELLTQDTAGFTASPAEALDLFGFALAAADFNGDGVDDLAVSSPGEDSDAGAVQIFFGHSGTTVLDSGIIHTGSVGNPQNWTADSPYVEGEMEAEDGFGISLAAADFNGDGYADLAVGNPLETFGAGAGALVNGGAINVFHGGEAGLTATAADPARLWHQDSPDMVDAVVAGEAFAYALAAADFDNDGYADLAIGVPLNRTFGTAIGAVHLMYGTSAGLTAARNVLIYDPDNPEADDAFGAAVSAGDFDGDGFTDLAAGTFSDDPVGVAADNLGSVFTFYSDGSGVVPTAYQNWYPGAGGLRGMPQTLDCFGCALPGSPYLP
jgi:hypothetical protein